MSNFVDLSVLVREPLTIKGAPDGETYVIPGNIPTEFVLTLQKKYNDIHTKDYEIEDEVRILKELIVDILNLDRTKKINIDYVNQYLDDVLILGKILQATMNHIKRIEEDENLSSPKSISKIKAKRK